MNSALQNTASKTGVYLYCLARPECLSSLDHFSAMGLHGDQQPARVTALTDDRVQPKVIALVSDVAIDDFSEENLQTLSWVGERASQHEAVVAMAMRASTVLPVKFGTIFRTVDSLKQFMAKHDTAIDQSLDALRDKTEWSVKGYLDEDKARDIIAAEDADIANRRAALSASPGARYMQLKQIDGLIEQAVEKGVALVAHDLLQALQAHASASRGLRCHASAMTGRDERMIFNASFLLTAEALEDFRDALAQQQEAYQVIGLSLELRGPWPAYNFCPDLSGTVL